MGGCTSYGPEYRSAVINGSESLQNHSLLVGSNLNSDDWKQTSDRRFGKIKSNVASQTGQEFGVIQLKFKNGDAASLVRERVNQRIAILHTNFQRPLEFKSSIEDGWCVSQLELHLLYEIPQTDVSLLMSVNGQNATGFSDDTLVQLWAESIQGMLALEANRLYHGHLSPRMIGWYKNESCFKILELPWFDAAAIRLADLNRDDFYFSPKVFRELASQPTNIGFSTTDRVYAGILPFLKTKDDVFSLGLILLYCGTGIPGDSFYDGFTQRLNEKRLENGIERLGSLHRNLPEFVACIKMMLQTNEEQRPDFHQLANKFPILMSTGQKRDVSKPSAAGDYNPSREEWPAAEEHSGTVWLRQWDPQTSEIDNRRASSTGGADRQFRPTAGASNGRPTRESAVKSPPFHSVEFGRSNASLQPQPLRHGESKHPRAQRPLSLRSHPRDTTTRFSLGISPDMIGKQTTENHFRYEAKPTPMIQSNFAQREPQSSIVWPFNH